MDTFESVKEKEDAFGHFAFKIDINVRSISAFVKNQPDTIVNIWNQFQSGDVWDEKILRGTKLNNFLHEIIAKWWEFHSPKEGAKLYKMQTRSAIRELKQLISFSPGQAGLVNSHRCDLSKQELMRFIEEMKQFTAENSQVKTVFEASPKPAFVRRDSGIRPSLGATRRVIAKKGINVLCKVFRTAVMETPMQKYERLKSEINTFNDSFRDFADNKLAANTRSGKLVVTGTEKELYEISELMTQTVGVSSEDSRKSKYTPNELLLESLSSHQDYQNVQEENKATVYNLFSKACLDGGQIQEIKTLEEQLVQIEKIFSMTSDAIYTKDAVWVIDFLSTRLNVLGDRKEIILLDTKVTKLEKELQWMDSKGQTSNERLKPAAARERIERVEKIIGILSTWDKAAEQLETVATRLKQLLWLNMEASEAMWQVKTYRTSKNTFFDNFDTEEDRLLLQSVVRSLVSRTNEIAQKATTLEERLLHLRNNCGSKLNAKS